MNLLYRFSAVSYTYVLQETISDEWKFLKTILFENVEPLVNSLEYGFRYKTPNRGSKGVTRFYNCRRIKVHAKVQCNRKVMVFIPNTEKDECSVSIKGQHTCNDMDSKSMAKMPLKQEDYNTINHMLRAGLPKKDIKKLLKARNSHLSTNRLNYAVKKASDEIYGSGTLSLGKSFLIIITIKNQQEHISAA